MDGESFIGQHASKLRIGYPLMVEGGLIQHVKQCATVVLAKLSDDHRNGAGQAALGVLVLGQPFGKAHATVPSSLMRIAFCVAFKSATVMPGAMAKCIGSFAVVDE